jgi:hypothetical protein
MPGIYLLVWDLTKPDEVKMVEFWLEYLKEYDVPVVRY